MFRKPGKILLTMLLATGISISLSSCFMIDKEDPANVKTISRTTDSVRIYQPGDFIDYNVTATDLNSFVVTQGTLRIQWEQTPNLIDPIDSVSYPVLKETTTLTFDDSVDATVIRYISQKPAGDVDEGSITLYAIDDGSSTAGNAAYWLYPNASTVPGSPIITPTIFDSPMAIGVTPSSPVGYSAMEGCDNGLCGTDIYTYSDNHSTNGDSTSITTNLGNFADPFEVNFTGGTNPKSGVTLSVLGDIRHACGDSINFLTHSGNMFIVPEIGMIQMTNTCQESGGLGNRVLYSISIRNTNIPVP